MDWKKEAARDVLALGGIPFYFIVFIRSVIGEFSFFIYSLPIAFVAWFFLRKLIIKNGNLHISLGFILMTYISGFYKQALFTAFAFGFWILMIASVRMSKTKWSEIIKGTVNGIVSAAIGAGITALILL
jgi:hypothetical protein